MPSFDFDTVPERRGTDSQKWQKYAGRDILPLWVADMDFRSPPAVIEALHRRVDQGIFGYARPVKSTVEAIVAAMEARYGWRIEPSWLVWLPGLVCGLNVAIEAFSQPGDEIISFTPVYPPFITAPKYRGRTSRTVPLRLRPGTPGRWEMDWDALERAVTPRTKVVILCHPHNPIARIWEPGEAAQLREFCARHNLILCSDEIHCDLILDPSRRHIPTATVGSAGRVVTMMAPSKTYNLPGLGTSLAIFSDAALRAQFERAAAGIVAEVTPLGYAACEAAYTASEPWRLALLATLRGNRDFLLDFIARELPGIRVDGPIEATYLAWLNVEALGLRDPAAHFEAHGVGLSDGAMFGAAPGSAVRLNFGCPRATLAEALRRMKAGLAAKG
jgi:cysteine-S-conjugate beta-lyase